MAAVQTIEERVSERIDSLRRECGMVDPYMVAESFCDEECARGDYDGCSPELELAFSQYMTIAERLLS